MFENLKKLYRHYGGLKAVVRSWYFWVAFILSTLSYRSALNFEWSGIALGVMPSLTGFTIAAFALIFAILAPSMLKLLIAPDKAGQSPISSIAAAIGHAVFIQVTAMVLAISVKSIDLDYFIDFMVKIIQCAGYSPNILLYIVYSIKIIASYIGLFCTYYGVLLILAAILSIVRMQLIVTDVAKSNFSRGPKPPPST